jgi:hypothetical protein
MMKKILIISPHFPPSNLAGVHRPRLFAQHLPEFGWKPVVLTVDEKYYEEMPDWNLVNLLPPGLRIEKVNAFKNTKPRLIGDIGLRAFFQLYKRARQLIQKEQFDFLYISIPSFYCALLGRWLHSSTGIKYGIDYIDPWVHQFPGSDKMFSRHWLSTKMAKLLEPIAIKKASLITGVAEGYYKPVLKRNPNLKVHAVCGAMPYGGEEKDHTMVSEIDIKPYLFQPKAGKLQFVYAGAMLPKAYHPLEAIFESIAANREQFKEIEFHFIGTGSRANDAESYNIKALAEKYGLWQSVVFEYPARIPYLDVLSHLEIAKAVFILGSTEPHYTPSKTYQGVLSKKPLMAILHKESTAVNVIRSSGAGLVLDFDGENEVELIRNNFLKFFECFRQFFSSFQPIQVDLKEFEQYSAKNVTKQLAALLDAVLEK